VTDATSNNSLLNNYYQNKQDIISEICNVLEVCHEDDFEYTQEEVCDDCSSECYDSDCECDCHDYPGYYHYAAQKIYYYFYKYVEKNLSSEQPI
jgi:hypothetical protein